MKINDPTTTSSTPHPIYFHSPLDQTMKGLSILAILLLHICSTGYNNASSHPSTLLVEAKTTKIRETPSTTKNTNVFSKKKDNKLHPQTKSDKRRVFSWVSIVVLVNILFFFRSFAVSTMLECTVECFAKFASRFDINLWHFLLFYVLLWNALYLQLIIPISCTT